MMVTTLSRLKNRAYPVGCQSRYWVSPLTTVEHLVSGC